MGLIRYSCGQISGHHEPIHVKFGVWGLFIMFYWNIVMKMLKCKKENLMTSHFSTLYSFVDRAAGNTELQIGKFKHKELQTGELKQPLTVNPLILQKLYFDNWKLLPLMQALHKNLEDLLLLSMWNCTFHSYLILQIFITCKINALQN